jgi:hypothetical protein
MIDGREVTASSFTVQGDPEIQLAEADRRKLFETSMQLHQMHRKLNEAIASVTALNEQVTMLEKMAKENPNLPSAVKSAIEDFAKKLAPVKLKFGVGISTDIFATGDFSFLENVRFRLPGLKSGVMASTSLPTETQTRVMGEMQTKLAQAIDEANTLISGLSALYKQMAESSVYPSMQKPVQTISK